MDPEGNKNIKKHNLKIKIKSSKKVSNKKIKIISNERRTENKKKSDYESRNSESLEPTDEFNYLYPHLDDPNFNVKLANKQEFFELRNVFKKNPIEQEADKICNPQNFESMNHQQIVKNFLSSETPYNNLLLFHGLGTGKTCSSILVCEEMRHYYKQLGINKKIIIIANPNVQENFRLQLFDESKLKKVNEYWNLDACTSNTFIQEINPMKMKGLTKEEVVRQIKIIIRQYYSLMGPEQFSNLLDKFYVKGKLPRANKLKLKAKFEGSLIVIDEVHNLRIIENKKTKNITKKLTDLATITDQLKFLFLSATPMFNSPREICWLINLMSINDNRSLLDENMIFNENDELIVNDEGEKIGEETLLRKLRGYVSFYRGENPYTFPYRIYPSMFMKENTMATYIKPTNQLNGKKLTDESRLKHMDLCVLKIGDYQNKFYETIIQSINSNIEKIEKTMKNDASMGYSILNVPLQALDMVYPNKMFDEIIETNDELRLKAFDFTFMVGSTGLSSIMNYNSTLNDNYKYKVDTIKNYGRIFSKENIKQYSSKIHFILDQIENSEGICLVYSQYIHGGCVPFALALEELGYTRSGRSNLFKDVSIPSNKMKYSMITGNKSLSPNNLDEIRYATKDENKDGSLIKVIIISEAASEGIDLKNIRQTHIIDPWWNLNRIEQIIGRSIRNCSHKKLPFEKRNVSIFQYGTVLKNTNVESADMYIYRTAEQKSIKIGKVTRVLKEGAMDCLLNKNVLSEEKLNQEKTLELSNKQKINYKVGDKPYSAVCDYLEDCEYKCKPSVELSENDVDKTTYSERFIENTLDVLILRIKDMFKDYYVLTFDEISNTINIIKTYPKIQIYYALTSIIDNKEILFDSLKNPGFLVNFNKYYLFQPMEITDKNISVYDRMRPLGIKPEKLNIELPDKIIEVNKKVRSAEEILKQIEVDFKYTQHENLIRVREKNVSWYKMAGNSIERLHGFVDTDSNIMKECVIERILDVMKLEDKIKLINYILFKEKLIPIQRVIVESIENNKIKIGTQEYLVFTDFSTKKQIVYFVNNIKQIIENADEIQSEEVADFMKTKRYDFAGYYGFMSLFKNDQYVIFRVKNRERPREKGFRCDQAGRSGRINTLNNILQREMYTKENTKKISNSIELCCDQELLLRYYNKIKVGNMDWFLNLEEYYSL